MKRLSPDIANLDLKTFMTAALEEALAAGRAGELPIGAVVVIDGGIVSQERARHRELGSQVRHAELNAILAGGERLRKNFQKAVLFTTVEPCPMCLGAAVMADIPHIVFGLHDPRMRSGQTIETNPYVSAHIRTYLGGVLEEKSKELFQRFDPEGLAYILSHK
jgi:tRNA(adenine34) deaminase